MSLIMQGAVVAVIDRKYGKDNPKAGQVYGRLYQLSTVVNDDGYVKIVDVDDFDLNRKVEIGKLLTVPVYAQIYIPVDKDTGRTKGEPRIQFHAMKDGNGVGAVHHVEEKKKI